jgi:hypothetical protein
MKFNYRGEEVNIDCGSIMFDDFNNKDLANLGVILSDIHSALCDISAELYRIREIYNGRS